MKKILLSITIFTSALSLFCCEYDKEKDEVVIIENIAYCDTATVTYNNIVKNIIDNNCALSGCHNVGSPYKDFTQYSGLKEVVDNGAFKKRVIEGNPTFMPPSGFTDESALKNLNCWLTQGAKEN